MILLKTNYGDIKLELDYDKAPETAKNFEQYVRDGFYDGLIFHRVISNFMIQGGGYTPALEYKPAPENVRNESFNGVRNSRGTIAMARRADPDSANSQFFINVQNNSNLDARGGNAGYTVFGRVISGMDVVEAIELVDTHLKNGMAAVPEEPVVIISVTRL